jgi:hypothetical protein
VFLFPNLTGTPQCTAIVRRVKVRSPLVLDRFDVIDVCTVKSEYTRNRAIEGKSIFIELLQEWLTFGISKINFKIIKKDGSTPITAMAIQQELDDMGKDELEQCIRECKTKRILDPKCKNMTDREKVIAQLGDRLVKPKTSDEDCAKFIVKFSDRRVLDFDKFINTDMVVFKHVNVLTGEIETFTAKQFLTDGHYKRLTGQISKFISKDYLERC